MSLSFKWRRYRQGKLGVVWVLESMHGEAPVASVRRALNAPGWRYIIHPGRELPHEAHGTGLKSSRAARKHAWAYLDRRSVKLFNADILCLVDEEIVA